MTFKVVDSAEASGDLPRDLGSGLILRWGKSEDRSAAVEFNGQIFGSEVAPDEGVASATDDWMSGKHPTVGPADFTLVVDANQGGQIVSSMTLVSQTWAYDGIAFKVGRPEAVGTDPNYRRRGLVREQFKAVHARSAQRGELMQVIAGIPWYYHQFGYELALAMQGERDLFWTNISTLEDGQGESYRLRPATVEDIELLSRLYAIHCAASLVTQLRNEADWRFALAKVHPKSLTRRFFWLIEDLSGEVIGYLGLDYLPDTLAVREMAVLPGYPLRLVAEFMTRALKTLSGERAKEENQPVPANGVSFMLGTTHPLYTALGEQLGRQKPPATWYVRIPDLPAFLHQIAPALDKRLQNSVFEGFSGQLRLNFYTSQLLLTWERGKLIGIETPPAKAADDGEAAFPDQTFLQLLLGYRSLADLQYAFADCLVTNERTRILVDTLFPQRPTAVAALA